MDTMNAGSYAHDVRGGRRSAAQISNGKDRQQPAPQKQSKPQSSQPLEQSAAPATSAEFNQRET